ncbi:MAG TPA: DHH family phosphoesterase [Erysipelotrichaceae bacterium]|nr:DHH family phosphoesterase [Erysipelotrichaceae bacterium]
MIHKIDQLKYRIIIIIALQIAITIIFKVLFDRGIFIAGIILISEAALLYYAFFVLQNEQLKHDDKMNELLGEGATDAFLFGEVGIVAYDENYIVTWMSDLFNDRGINRVGKKILVWLPEVDSLISGQDEIISVSLDERKYEIRRRDDAPMLFFRDITEKEKYKAAYEDEQVVIGMINLDNYDESTQYEDESVIANINSGIRTLIIDYAREKGMLLRRINNYRYLLVLNEKIFSNLVNDRFSIMNKVRAAANQLEVSITLSMAFARGSNKYEELDEMVIKLLDLAQNRGGDQVAVRKAGEAVKYFGGSSEAAEKRSRVRVRIIAHALRGLIQKCSNVIICMHKDADFDCMGAAMGISRIVTAYNKTASIIARTGGIEEKLNAVLEDNKEVISSRFNFISENEANNQLRKDTLVIMVDHHNISQSNGASVLEKAKTIAIIDHHRRSADLKIKPTLIYIEAGASSTCELVTEFIPYLSNRIDISDMEASIMLAGMTIDTNRFKIRTGTRTYDAASYLRGLGGDPLVVDEYIKDTYSEFAAKSYLLSKIENIGHGIIIAASDRNVSRSIISQVGDSLLEVKGVEAAFIISKTSEDEVAVSSRSNGNVNVQVLMEKMDGGGHMTAAGVQKKNTTVDNVKEELLVVLEEYIKFEEGNVSESNTTD